MYSPTASAVGVKRVLSTGGVKYFTNFADLLLIIGGASTFNTDSRDKNVFHRGFNLPKSLGEHFLSCQL